MFHTKTINVCSSQKLLITLVSVLYVKQMYAKESRPPKINCRKNVKMWKTVFVSVQLDWVPVVRCLARTQKHSA